MKSEDIFACFVVLVLAAYIASFGYWRVHYGRFLLLLVTGSATNPE